MQNIYFYSINYIRRG